MDAAARARSAGRAVRLRAEQRAFADGRKPAAAHVSGSALYVKSAGVRKGELDPFAVAVMAELGQDISGHKPMTFEELDDWEGLNFDLIITLAPEAHHRALELTRTLARRGRILADRTTRPAPRATASRSCEAYREVCDAAARCASAAVFEAVRRAMQPTSGGRSAPAASVEAASRHDGGEAAPWCG